MCITHGDFNRRLYLRIAELVESLIALFMLCGSAMASFGKAFPTRLMENWSLGHFSTLSVRTVGILHKFQCWLNLLDGLLINRCTSCCGWRHQRFWWNHRLSYFSHKIRRSYLNWDWIVSKLLWFRAGWLCATEDCRAVFYYCFISGVVLKRYLVTSGYDRNSLRVRCLSYRTEATSRADFERTCGYWAY